MEDATAKALNSMANLSPIQEFYSNTNILITGGTGFFGNVLMEKLLRSCPTISKIYILIRNKRGIESKVRVLEILDDVLFTRLKEECPDFRSKVVGIHGDLTLPNLGLSVQNEKLLIDEINIIFHVGATVKFNEKLTTAVLTNIRSTRDIVNLAHQMRNLKAMIHVSSVYSNCIQDIVEEKIYPPAFDSKQVIYLAENLPENIVDKLKDMLLENYPNTYVFTKQIAEDVVNQCGHDLPSGIHRPAIIVSTYKEPIKSWTNNLYSATGVVANAGLGMLRIVHGNGISNANVIPVDMCVNSLIASAWDVGVTFQKNKKEGKPYEIPVYNYESNGDKPIAWKDFLDKDKICVSNYPSIKAIWFYMLIITPNSAAHKLFRFLLHTLPAVIVDAALLCTGKSPKMMKITSQINKFCDILTYFSLRTFKYKSQNIRNLIIKLSDRDKKLFFFDLKELDWDEFLQTYFYGIRLYIFKESIDTLPEAKKKLKRLYWAHQFTKLVVGSMLLWIVCLLTFPICRFSMMVFDKILLL